MLIGASRFYEIGLSLLAFGAVAACTVNDYRGNCNPAGATSQAGSRSTAGASSGSGGKSSGSGGKTSGNGGETGVEVSGGDGTVAAGAGAVGGTETFACAAKQPSSRGITDFGNLEADATRDGQFVFTTVLPGSTFSYPDTLLTLSNTAMALNASGNINVASGFGVYFSDCIDASAVAGGVTFSIRGTVGDSGTLSFRVLTNATTAVDGGNRRGSCDAMGQPADASCLAASVDIPVTAEGADVVVRWSELAGGVPIDTVDGSDMIGFEWAFSYDGATPYDADVTVDNLSFIAKDP